MYQITAICYGSEYAYAEGETFAYALDELAEDVARSSIYPARDATLTWIDPAGNRFEAPASRFFR